MNEYVLSASYSISMAHRHLRLARTYLSNYLWWISLKWITSTRNEIRNASVGLIPWWNFYCFFFYRRFPLLSKTFTKLESFRLLWFSPKFKSLRPRWLQTSFERVTRPTKHLSYFKPPSHSFLGSEIFSE